MYVWFKEENKKKLLFSSYELAIAIKVKEKNYTFNGRDREKKYKEVQNFRFFLFNTLKKFTNTHILLLFLLLLLDLFAIFLIFKILFIFSHTL